MIVNVIPYDYLSFLEFTLIYLFSKIDKRFREYFGISTSKNNIKEKIDFC